VVAPNKAVCEMATSISVFFIIGPPRAGFPVQVLAPNRLPKGQAIGPTGFSLQSLADFRIVESIFLRCNLVFP
jgi:hypothetical protein